MVKGVFPDVATKQRPRTRFQARVGRLSASSGRRPNSSECQDISGSRHRLSLHAIRSDSRLYSSAWPLGRCCYCPRAGLYRATACSTRSGRGAPDGGDTRSRSEPSFSCSHANHLTARWSRPRAALLFSLTCVQPANPQPDVSPLVAAHLVLVRRFSETDREKAILLSAQQPRFCRMGCGSIGQAFERAPADSNAITPHPRVR